MPAQEHEDRERTITVAWQDPDRFRETIESMSGLDYLEAMLRGEIPGPPIGSLVNFQLTEAERGRVVFEFTPAEYHFNPFGSAHGGIPATMLDSAAACAVHSTLPQGIGYTTLEIKVNFVRPVTMESGRMRCEGTVVHEGRRVATAEARMTDRGGRLYAHGTSTCLIYRP
jgi:uncharacterized protein (TIGR00369 family)